MPSIYPKRGIWYAPDWRNPLTGAIVSAHSLGTGDRKAAEVEWIKQQAALVAQPAEQGTFNPMVASSILAEGTDLPLGEALRRYLEWKRREIESATLRCYEGHARDILRHLGNPTIRALAADSAILAAYVEREVTRLGGRTHTVKKRLEALIKPALRHCVETGVLDRLPVFPRLRSDQREQHRTAHWTRDEFAAVRRELPAQTLLAEDGRACYPRRWLDLAVTTGMHASDLDRFAAQDFDERAGLWLRRNSKGDAHYAAEWMPCDPFLMRVLREAVAQDGLAGPRCFTVARLTTEPPPPKQWMRRRLRWACHRAGVETVPSPNDLRRTCATWKREDGWDFEETAKWLANSSGMVREVYAQIPRAAMVRAVDRSAAGSHNLLRLTGELRERRRPPRRPGRLDRLTRAPGKGSA